jgi:hypothetical protein
MDAVSIMLAETECESENEKRHLMDIFATTRMSALHSAPAPYICGPVRVVGCASSNLELEDLHRSESPLSIERCTYSASIAVASVLVG